MLEIWSQACDNPVAAPGEERPRNHRQPSPDGVGGRFDFRCPLTPAAHKRMRLVTESPATDSVGASQEPAKKPRINWDDPDIPVGNAPSMHRWPLIASALVFAAWMVFLVAMAVLRIRTTAY